MRTSLVELMATPAKPFPMLNGSRVPKDVVISLWEKRRGCPLSIAAARLSGCPF